MKAFALAVALALPFAVGCVRKIEPPEETLGSFEVKLDFERAPSPGVVLATCPCPLPGCDETDLCPGAPGSTAEDVLIPFNGERAAQVHLDITAIGTEGTKPFPWNGRAIVRVAQGNVIGTTAYTTLEEGVAEDVLVRLRRTPGPTYIWVEDSFDLNESPPTFAVGVSDVALHFAQPRIEDIQRTDDECCSPMQGQRVEITDGELYVTRVVGNGFNVQDVRSPEWGGLFVFAFNGIEGLRTGTRLLSLGGAVTEFQGATQLTEPIYTPVNGLCGEVRGTVEGGIDTNEEETGIARTRCPRNSQCIRGEDGVERCTPDGDPSLDEYGRKICTLGGGANCPAGTRCQHIEGQGTFCQVAPLDAPVEAFPEAPYCGPIYTDRNLDIERHEGALVRIVGHGEKGVRVEGLPVCRMPPGLDGKEAIDAVRSTCNPADFDDGGQPRIDCTVATNGEPLLRDDDGDVCLRGNQACLDDGREVTKLRSSCFYGEDNCRLAEPGQPVLIDGEGEDARICRGTLDDFLTSGLRDFGQAKVYFEDESGRTRCATVNFEALAGFDLWKSQERGERWRSLTGTLRQVRFRSGSSFWIVDVRFPEDLEPLER